MFVPGRGTITPVQYEQHLGSLGFSFKKLGRFVSKAAAPVVKTVAKATQLVSAPIRAAVLAPLKATTWAAKSVGVPVKRFDSFLKTEVNTAVKDTKTIAPIVVGTAAGFVTGGAGWVLAAKAGADLLDKSMPKGNARVAAPSTLAPVNPMPSIADQANATVDVATTPTPGQQPNLPGQPNQQAVKAIQAGFLPAGPAMPYIIGGLAIAGLIAIATAARSKPSGPPGPP
jgi:hypothetical protein